MVNRKGGNNKASTKSIWNKLHVGDAEKKIYRIQDDCYYYTTLDTFHKIVENDEIWSTQLRFSNDSEEYNAGYKILHQEFNGIDLKSAHEYYMICFCEKDDLLSQWREYARRGVSLKMDFTGNDGGFFTIVDKNYNSKIENEDVKKQKKLIGEMEKHLKYALPLKVIYANYRKEETGKYSGHIVDDNNDNIPFKKYFSDVKKIFDENPEKDVIQTQRLRELVPLIKNSGFKEELEARLLFSLDIRQQDVCKRFRSEPNLGYQIPYVVLKYGDMNDNLNVCNSIRLGKGIDTGIFEEIKRKLASKHGWTDDMIGKIGMIEDTASIGSMDIYIGQGSNQKVVFEELRRIVKNTNDKDIKIWCDGHWPIRHITVGPSFNQDIVRESIEHYIRSKYWLTFVSVESSNTPYRDNRIK